MSRGRQDTATDTGGELSVEVDCEAPVDVDIHLLEGADADACRARAHTSLEHDLSPGRYLLVVDTWVDDGEEFAGDFTLRVSLE